MSSLNSDNAGDVHDVTNDHLEEGVDQEHLSKGLTALVDKSITHPDVSETIHAPTHKPEKHSLLNKFIPGFEKLATRYHVGNFVIVRGTNEKIFESMPIYARIGMHLLFYGKEQVKFLEYKTVEQLLHEQSIKEGKLYDSPDSVASIPSFIQTYSIQLSELLYPDISSYKTFNEFFYRKLREDGRPVQNPEDPNSFCSAADSRLMVFDNLDQATSIWIKGKQFTIPNLLGDAQLAQHFVGASIAVFRLAPADYHRFHSPADVIVGDQTDIPGQYYTVNPQAVNEPNFDVFTANRRSVLLLQHQQTNLPIAFVAIGALLVGSIVFTVKPGQVVKRGEELGYFKYGGSTCVVLFPKGMIQFDEDLRKNSLEEKIETVVKVGYSLGTKIGV